MSIGPLGVFGSVASSPLAQTRGSEVDRASQETADQARETKASQQAEQAAGIGQTEQDEQSSDRDADGRRVWEFADGQQKQEEDDESSAQDASREDELKEGPRSKDPTGQCGNTLDLNG